MNQIQSPQAAKKLSPKKKSKRKGGKKKAAHLKPRKPYEKQKGVLAFPGEKDYRDMMAPAKKKIVPVDRLLGDGSSVPVVKKIPASPGAPTHLEAPKKIIPGQV